jgi:predicted HicB family RNase H-like nuclease
MAPPKKPIELHCNMNISVKITPSLHKAIQTAAKVQRISKSELIRNSLINLNLPEAEKTA